MYQRGRIAKYRQESSHQAVGPVRVGAEENSRSAGEHPKHHRVGPVQQSPIGGEPLGPEDTTTQSEPEPNHLREAVEGSAVCGIAESVAQRYHLPAVVLDETEEATIH